MAAAEDISQDTDVCEWWKRHDGEIPSWAKTYKLILLIQPSSAAVERAFSLLENSFSKRQEHSLEDCFTLYHASVQQKALIFVSQNMIVFIVYNVE